MSLRVRIWLQWQSFLDKLEVFLRNFFQFFLSEKSGHVFMDIMGVFLIFSVPLLLIYQTYIFLVTNSWPSYSILTVLQRAENTGDLQPELLNNLYNKLPGFITVFDYTPIHVVLIILGIAALGNFLARKIIVFLSGGFILVHVFMILGN